MIIANPRANSKTYGAESCLWVNHLTEKYRDTLPRFDQDERTLRSRTSAGFTRHSHVCKYILSSPSSITRAYGMIVSSQPLDEVCHLKVTPTNRESDSSDHLDFERCAALHNAIVKHTWVATGQTSTIYRSSTCGLRTTSLLCRRD